MGGGGGQGTFVVGHGVDVTLNFDISYTFGSVFQAVIDLFDSTFLQLKFVCVYHC